MGGSNESAVIGDAIVIVAGGAVDEASFKECLLRLMLLTLPIGLVVGMSTGGAVDVTIFPCMR